MTSSRTSPQRWTAPETLVEQSSEFTIVVLPPIGLIAAVVLVVVAVIVVLRRLRR